MINLLKDYYKKYRDLVKTGGPEEDGDLFTEVINLEEQLLEKFGMPLSKQFRGILWQLVNREKVTEKHYVQTLERLQAAADRYFFSPGKTDLELLTSAMAEKRIGFDVLPELGHPTHEYTLFLYDTMLIFVSPKEVLAELSALKQLNCYGEIATLKTDYPRTFRHTRAYRQLMPHLKFLDAYITATDDEPLFYYQEEELETLHPLEMMRFTLLKEDEVEEPVQESISNTPFMPTNDYKPTYFVISDPIEIEEIIFGRSSSVTVTGKLHECYQPTSIALGFDFDMLASIIREYRQLGHSVLNYFNRDRQNNAIQYPVVVNLKDKLGKTLVLDQHYFNVYRPLTPGSNVQAELIKEAFFIVDELVDKPRYDQQQVEHMKSNLNAWFNKMKHHYGTYLNLTCTGMSEELAKRDYDLEDQVRFEVSKLLFLLEKHGGRAEVK